MKVIDNIKNITHHISKKKLIISIIIIVIIAGIFTMRIINNKKDTKVKNNITTVKTVKPSINSISTYVEYSCQIKPIKQVDVSAKMAGKITSLNVDVGSKVSSGQVLFTLDSSELKAQVDQQQAALDSANANLGKTKGAAVDQPMIQAEQTLQSAAVSYNDAQDYYNKMQSLYSAGAVSEQDLQTATTKYKTAEVAYNGAKNNFNVISNEVGPESIQAAQAQVAQSEAAVESAKVQLSNATVTAPISGTISVVNAKQGEMTPTAASALTIIDTSTLDAEVNVSDKVMSKLKSEDKIKIEIGVLKDKNITGTIYSIGPAADSKTQTYIVKIKVDNSSGELKPGMFTKVELPDEKVNNVITVPVEAVKIENGVSYIYKVSNGKVKKVSVETGLSNDKYVEVKSNNIYETDNIITEGQLFLNDNQKVKMVN